jgi:hypothetical protein
MTLIDREFRLYQRYGTPETDALASIHDRRRRRRITQRDPMGRETGTIEEDDAVPEHIQRAFDRLPISSWANRSTVTVEAYDAHVPGYRYGVTAADQQRATDAYNEMVADLQTQWMSLEQRLADNARLTTDSCPTDVDPRTWAYSEMVQDLTDAWKPRDSVDVTKAGAAAPHILPAGAVLKGIGLEPGDSCTLDGRPGVYEDGGDGYLYCRPRSMTRADAVPHTMDAVAAQAIKDHAYQEYCSYIRNAWKA